MQRKDWTLLAIASAKGASLRPVQLQKSLFLLGQERSQHLTDFYEFEAYYWGPFDKAIFEDAEALEIEGLVRILRPPRRSWKEYVATEEGLQRAGQLGSSAPEEAVSYLAIAVSWARGLSFQDLVSQIYEHYPEFGVNSLFRETA